MTPHWNDWPVVVCDSKDDKLIKSVNKWLTKNVKYENFFQSSIAKNHFYVNDEKALLFLQLKYPVNLSNMWKYNKMKEYND